MCCLCIFSTNISPYAAPADTRLCLHLSQACSAAWLLSFSALIRPGGPLHVLFSLRLASLALLRSPRSRFAPSCFAPLLFVALALPCLVSRRLASVSCLSRRVSDPWVLERAAVWDRPALPQQREREGERDRETERERERARHRKRGGETERNTARDKGLRG